MSWRTAAQAAAPAAALSCESSLVNDRPLCRAGCRNRHLPGCRRHRCCLLRAESEANRHLPTLSLQDAGLGRGAAGDNVLAGACQSQVRSSLSAVGVPLPRRQLLDVNMLLPSSRAYAGSRGGGRPTRGGWMPWGRMHCSRLPTCRHCCLPALGPTLRTAPAPPSFVPRRYDWLGVFLPCVAWMRTYDIRAWLPADVLAGLSVACMEVPQGLSYAGLAGLPSVYGLYGATVPCLVYCLFGSSRQLVRGTACVCGCMCPPHQLDSLPALLPPTCPLPAWLLLQPPWPPSLTAAAAAVASCRRLGRYPSRPCCWQWG